MTGNHLIRSRRKDGALVTEQVGATASAAPPASAPVRLRMRTRRVVLGDVLLLGGSRKRVRLAPYDADAERFLWALAAGGTPAELLDTAPSAQVRDRHAAWLQALDAGDLLERMTPPASADRTDLARFDRMLHLLSELETDQNDRFALLERLRAARVCVVGAGGLASWILYNLVCCGVGELRLVDSDTVSLSNLNRSILFTERDAGRAKVEAARDGILRFAPRTRVRTVAQSVDSANRLAELLDDVDVLVATGDQPPWLIREWVAVATQRTRTAVIHPAGGRVGPFWLPGEAVACGLCDWASIVAAKPARAQQLVEQRRLPPADPGPLSMIGAVTAGVAAMEVFRHLVGRRPRTVDAVWTMRDDFTADLVPAGRHDSCPLCGEGEDRVPPPSGTG